MAVKIRLARYGRKKRPFYRIVATDSKMRRDGRFLELLGTVDPLQDPPAVNLKEDRVKHWISAGASPSDTMASIISRQLPGYLDGLESERRERIRNRRAARKARAKERQGLGAAA